MSVSIVTDSGSDLPLNLENEIHIYTVPLVFRFGNEEFPDKSMPMQDFLHKVEKVWPSTSAPSPGDYLRVFQEALADHEQAFCITISGRHSASYSSAIIASRQFRSGQVTVFDSQSLSIGQGLQVLAASRAAQAGDDPGKILARLKDLQSRSHLYITLDTIQYLVKGGRASQLAGILAGLLKIRPVLTLREGLLTLLEKPRGRQVSKQRLLELAISHFPAEYVSVGHVNCPDEAVEIASTLTHRMGYAENGVPALETGMAIATHGGPGTLGVVVVSKK
jgi:DegV family protein with EDD domain